jgi:putative NADH-flavin reductase
VNITVFGATGRTGRAFIHAARKEGHTITAVVRDRTRLLGAPATHVIRGGAFDVAAIDRAVTGADAVMIAYRLQRNRRTTPLYSQGTALVIEAMKRHGVRRLLVVSGAPYDHHTSGLAGRVAAATYRTVAGPVIRERRAQDQILAASGLAWTVFRPVVLVDGPAVGGLPLLLTPTASFAPRTTFADLSEMLVRAIDDPTTFQESVYP